MEKQQSSAISKLKNTTIAGYGAAFFGYGFVTQMFASYLVFYATVILKISGSVIGLIISLSIVWDAVSDPVMGYISDNTTSRLGKRHVYILVGSILLTIVNTFLWQVSLDASDLVKFIWILASVFLIKTFVTVFVTPYAALGAELSTDYNERTKIQTVKTVYFLVSLMLVTAVSMFVFFVPTVAYPVGQLNPIAYKNMGYTASILMLVTGLITYFSTKKYAHINPVKSGQKLELLHFIKIIKYSFTNKEFRIVFLGYLFTNIASAIIGVIGLHTFTYTFQMNNYKIGVVLAVQFSVCVIAQPIWLKISKVLEKKDALLWGLKISILGCLILMTLVFFREQVIIRYEFLIVYAAVIGFGTSGLFSIPLSMVADTVDLQEEETDERNEGIFYGMLNFGYKISQSIAILILGFILDIIKFDPYLSIQKNLTAFNLGIVLSVGSMIAFFMAIKAYKGYTLNEEKITVIQEKLLERRAQK